MKEVTVMKVKLGNELLNEVKDEVVFIKDDIIFVGALFMEFEEHHTFESIECEYKLEYQNDKELVKKVIEAYRDLKGDTHECTQKTMNHWQFMNDFTDTITSEYTLED